MALAGELGVVVRRANCKPQSMINVILAEHDRIFRIGMASVLAVEDDIRIVGQPATPAQLIRGVEMLCPHVVVLSSRFLPWIDAVRVAGAPQHTAILLVRDDGAQDGTGFSEDYQGVLDRSADEQCIVRHVRQLARGGRVIRIGAVGGQARDMDAVGYRVQRRLTAAELGIIAYVVRGHKNREIAKRVGATEQTIKNSLRRIFDKTGVFGRLELALFVVHHRIAIAAPEGSSTLGKQTPLFAPVGDWVAGRPPSVN
jgi:DNA-binding NarL/FixJ family response regulator